MKTPHPSHAVKPTPIHSNNKALTLNGCPVIELITYYQCITSSIFLNENILIFVREGCFKLRHGKIEYQVTKDQVVLLKKNILLEFDICSPNPDFLRGECILFTVSAELLKEFARLAELHITPAEDASA